VLTQPALYTPAAQTTALASIVLRATKPPANNNEMLTYFMTVFMTVLPGLQKATICIESGLDSRLPAAVCNAMKGLLL
jgi:hypothetical protein